MYNIRILSIMTFDDEICNQSNPKLFRIKANLSFRNMLFGIIPYSYIAQPAS